MGMCHLFIGSENRIIESLRLEKTSKIIKSSCQLNTTMPAKPCPETISSLPTGFGW